MRSLINDGCSSWLGWQCWNQGHCERWLLPVWVSQWKESACFPWALGEALCPIVTTEQDLNGFYCYTSSVASKQHSILEQWISLIHVICVSDEWEELSDSFRRQLFIYLLTLLLEKYKCIMYGILCYCPCIYVTLDISKILNFMKNKLP